LTRTRVSVIICAVGRGSSAPCPGEGWESHTSGYVNREEYDTSEGAHPHWPDRFFAWLVDTYLSRSGNSGARVGDAQAFLIDARGLLDFALEVMPSVAADPARIEVATSSRTSAPRP
jgi:hypothetical protein